MPKIKPDELPLYDRGVLIEMVPDYQYMPMLESSAWLATSTSRRLMALHVNHKDGRELTSCVPRGKRFSYVHHTGEARLWQHSKRALEPCPEREALLTGQLLPASENEAE